MFTVLNRVVPVNLLSSGFIFVEVVAFGFGFVLLILAIRWVARESRILEKVGESLADQDLLAPDNPDELKTRKQHLLEDVLDGKESLIARRIRHLGVSFSVGLQPNLDQIERAELADASGRIRASRYIQNSLLMIGLLGTALGLMWAIAGLDPLLDQEAGELLKILRPGMRSALGSMSLAFSSTAAALVLSLPLLFLMAAFGRQWQKWQRNVDDFTHNWLMPWFSFDMRQVKFDESMEKLVESNNSLNNVVSKLNEHNEQMVGIYRDMRSIASDLRDTTERNFERIRSYDERLFRYQEEVRATIAQVEAMLTELSADRADFSATVRGYLKRMDHTQLTMQQWSERLVGASRTLYGMIHETSNELRAQRTEGPEQYRDLLNQISREASQALQSIQSAHRDSMNAVGQQVSDSIRQLADVEISRNELAFDAMDERLKSRDESIIQLVQRIISLLTTMEEARQVTPVKRSNISVADAGNNGSEARKRADAGSAAASSDADDTTQFHL
ncbi:MotA/TolQ/ExbB proton channel family protein [bacterium]|nr:MotA/TolQ/ExbB proton channel family protein [bacterium]